MNQICKVCGEPAAGFHFGAFTCEGCKSFFGRSYNNVSSITECKNNGKCIIDKKNRTTCKACRLRKCYSVGMSKGGSRYGRRSNWFKIHCLLQEQQQQAVEAANKAAGIGAASPNGLPSGAAGAFDMSAAAAAQQQRNSHMAAAAAAQHMNSLLGYSSYLPTTAEMLAASANSPFSTPNAAAAAALPFFSMLPNIGSTQSAFPLPPHLLFPGYHPGAAAAVAAADASYRNEMYRHRQSVDSAGSAESQSRYSPAAEQRVPSANSLVSSANTPWHVTYEHNSTNANASDDERRSSAMSALHSLSPVSLSSSIAQHQIHSPIAVRATPKTVSPTPSTVSVGSAKARTPEPMQHSHAAEAPEQQEQATPTPTAPQTATLTFAAKMQSLSPVSVCSIGAETAPTGAPDAIAQDCPMDLSMKTSRSSVYSFNTSAGESGVHSDASEEDATPTIARARKFHELMSSENESDVSLDAADSIKRPKLEAAEHSSNSDSNAASATGNSSNSAATPQSYNRFAHSAATSMCGIFVCV